MMDNGSKDKKMGLENIFILIQLIIKVAGIKIKNKDMEYSKVLKVSMWVNGKMIKSMVKVAYLLKMDINLKEFGKTINLKMEQ